MAEAENVSDVQIPADTRIDPALAFLKKYQDTAIAGWKEIYEHLASILKKCKECKETTTIRYKTLTVKICGKITVDKTLEILTKWEYYHIIEYANAISLQTQYVRAPNFITIQHGQGKKYEYGLVRTGPWTPLSPYDHNPLHAFISTSGSDDYTNVELFNGFTNKYLKVVEESDGSYHVEVAERPLQADTLSRFDLSDPNGTIRLVVDRFYYLKVYEGDQHVDAIDIRNENQDPMNIPELHFDITFY